MIRIVGTFSLIATIMVQTLSTSFILATFQINQSTFTALYCVNKDNPDMHCDGHCFLNKQMKTNKENHKNTAETIPDFISLVFTLSENIIQPFPPNDRTAKSDFYYRFRAYSSTLTSIFHPPRV